MAGERKYGKKKKRFTALSPSIAQSASRGWKARYAPWAENSGARSGNPSAAGRRCRRSPPKAASWW